MEASIRDLRYKTREILTAVAGNNEVVITSRGKRIARMVPYRPATGPGPADHSFGMWKDHPDLKKPDRWLDRIRSPR